MDNFGLQTFPSADALAAAVAREFLSFVEMGARHNRNCVALSGGRIAGRFFSALSAMAKPRPPGMGLVEFFWGDERCVPPEDPESNFALARERLLMPLDVPEARIHRIRGEADPKEAAAQAEAELRQLATEMVAGQPVLDLVLLGMGEDGHVASLFPGEPEEAVNQQAVFRPVIGPKPPPSRVTLGYPAISAARQVWVLASGQGKEAALHESLSPAGRTPLARVLRLRPHTKIFSDILRGNT